MGIHTLMRQKAIFLDRDGVLNKAVIKNNLPYPPSSIAELVIVDDAQEALKQLKTFNFLLIGATNQPDVARGKTSVHCVEEINQQLIKTLSLDEIRVCYHDDADQCKCRKPLPGLIMSAAKDYNIDLSLSYMIGDRWRDIEAGSRAGCKTIWLRNDYKEKKPMTTPTYIADSLLQAAEWILKCFNMES